MTIYLYDRLGRMQPIDYINFFEEFAARACALTGVPANALPPFQSTVETSREPNPKDAASTARSEVVLGSGLIDQSQKATAAATQIAEK